MFVSVQDEPLQANRDTRPVNSSFTFSSLHQRLIVAKGYKTRVYFLKQSSRHYSKTSCITHYLLFFLKVKEYVW